MPAILAIVLVLLAMSVGAEGPHTVWDEEDAEREAALARLEDERDETPDVDDEQD